MLYTQRGKTCRIIKYHGLIQIDDTKVLMLLTIETLEGTQGKYFGSKLKADYEFLEIMDKVNMVQIYADEPLYGEKLEQALKEAEQAEL